ncbi:MAG: hypothetical protein RH942_14450 [Kiloniellaceae bacterium]
MTISTTTAKSRYAGDGATASFPTGFKFLDNAQVRVILRAADGSESLWTEGSEYSLSGAGAPGGGTVEVETSPTDHTPAAGETLVVKLSVPPLQETSLPLGGAFPSTAVEAMADLAALRDQQIEEALSRAPKLKESTALADIQLPEPEAGWLVGWNSGGTGLENIAPPADGADGADGRTVLNGSGAPAAGQGSDGDFYIDTAATALYGPKAAGAWGGATSLLGPQGATGAAGATGATGATGAAGANGTDGADGTDGTDGKTVLNGAGAPAGGTGANGDFYIDTAATALYGPKTGGSWGSATSLLGPQGATGATGAPGAAGVDGADGVGVPAGGSTGQVLAKTSGTDYATGWVGPGLADLADDATPQLGGALDGQGNTSEDVAMKVAAAKTASFTFAAAEAGILTPCNAAAAMNATVPPNASVAYAVGTTLAIWNQGAGAVTWVAGAGVTLSKNAALTLVSGGQHSVSFAIKTATNAWVVSGDLEAA